MKWCRVGLVSMLTSCSCCLHRRLTMVGCWVNLYMLHLVEVDYSISCTGSIFNTHSTKIERFILSLINIIVYVSIILLVPPNATICFIKKSNLPKMCIVGHLFSFEEFFKEGIISVPVTTWNRRNW